MGDLVVVYCPSTIEEMAENSTTVIKRIIRQNWHPGKIVKVLKSGKRYAVQYDWWKESNNFISYEKSSNIYMQNKNNSGDMKLDQEEQENSEKKDFRVKLPSLRMRPGKGGRGVVKDHSKRKIDRKKNNKKPKWPWNVGLSIYQMVGV